MSQKSINNAPENSIYYIENTEGKIVRSLAWDTTELYFIYRHDTKRVESVSDLKELDKNEIPYSLLETIEKKSFALKKRYPLKSTKNELYLVSESEEIIEDVDSIEDDLSEFKDILIKTFIGFTFLMGFFGIIYLFVDPVKKSPDELEIVQVLDREQLKLEPKVEKITVAPSKEKVKITNKIVNSKKVIKKVITKNSRTRIHKPVSLSSKNISVNSLGVLGVLGSAQKSNQRGGLKINQAQVSKGVGLGGSEGSGGVQAQFYGKGFYATALGHGGNVHGQGGYGTKGRGGGEEGYGKISLVGSGGHSGNSFFEPIESEVWTEGGLDKNAISAVIFRHLSEVRFCYEKGLQIQPRLSGRVAINFVINPVGVVSMANINNSSLNQRQVESCIRDHLKTWKFPRPQGGVHVKVSYPFVLQRVGAG